MSALRGLRLAALLEGVSLLALLFVAMPLKYLYGLPAATRVLGGAHGLFFLLFISALYRVTQEHDWPPRRYLAALVASVVPGGTFLLDRAIDRELRGEGEPSD